VKLAQRNRTERSEARTQVGVLVDQVVDDRS
jgi:hypothetical protein